MGVDIIAIGAGSVDKTQLLEMTGQRSNKVFTGNVSKIEIRMETCISPTMIRGFKF